MKHQWILVLGLILAVMAQLSPAQADRFESCQVSCKHLSGHITSDECVDTCNRSTCNRLTISYGAIAYGAQSTANGYAFGKGLAGDAARPALSFCRHHGNDSKGVAAFSNSCAAVTAIESKGVLAVGDADTRGQAQSKAMGAYASQHGSGCEIEIWACAQP